MNAGDPCGETREGLAVGDFWGPCGLLTGGRCRVKDSFLIAGCPGDGCVGRRMSGDPRGTTKRGLPAGITDRWIWAFVGYPGTLVAQRVKVDLEGKQASIRMNEDGGSQGEGR